MGPQARLAYRSGFLLWLALALAGCQIAPPANSPATTRPAEPFRNAYTQARDSAPATARNIDYRAIPDAVPRDEPASRYGNKSPYTVNGRSYQVQPSAEGYRAEGTASWYGEKFHGFMTSSMEPYDMYAMTAAHTTLPIPSYVRVTHLENGRSVVVRVNDRGPFHDGRIIDLSWAAAQKLGYADTGTAPVRIEVLTARPSPAATSTHPTPEPVPEPTGTAAPIAADDTPAPTPAPTFAPIPVPAAAPATFFVQLGAFALPDAARRLGEQARTAVGESPLVIAGADALHRVQFGPYPDRALAEHMRDRLARAGIGHAVLTSGQ